MRIDIVEKDDARRIAARPEAGIGQRIQRLSAQTGAAGSQDNDRVRPLAVMGGPIFDHRNIVAPFRQQHQRQRTVAVALAQQAEAPIRLGEPFV